MRLFLLMLILLVQTCSPCWARNLWYHGGPSTPPVWVTPKDKRSPWHDEIDKAVEAAQKAKKAYDFDSGEVNRALLDTCQREEISHIKKALELSVAAKDFRVAGRISYYLAITLKVQGKSSEAVQEFKKAIDYLKNSSSEDTVDIADCYTQLAWLRRDRGKKDLAFDDAMRAYEIYKRLFSQDDIKFSGLPELLAQYSATPQDAVPYRRQIIEILKKNDPEDPGLIAGMIYDLAIDLGNSGQLEEAINQAEQAVRWCQRGPGNYALSQNINESIEHWRKQQMGLEPQWDVIYNGKFAGRNPRGQPEHPYPPTIAGKGEKEVPPVESGKGHNYLVNGRSVTKAAYDAARLANEASDLISQHKFQDARDKLLRSLELDPGLVHGHANLGFVLSKLGQVDQAIVHLTKAVQLAPDRSAPLAMLASVYQSNGQLDNSITAFKLYMERFPEEQDLSIVKALINDLVEVRKEQKSIETKHSPQELAEDYLLFATSKGTVRWNKTGKPIKVFVETATTLRGYKPNFPTIVKQCFQEWAEKENNRFLLEFTSIKTDADILCHFTNNFNEVSSLAEAGETQMRFDDKGNFKRCLIVLLTENANSTLTPSENDIRAVSLHEAGHSLGLIGHSPRPADIMFCTTPGDTEVRRPELSLRDRKTLSKLYSDK